MSRRLKILATVIFVLIVGILLHPDTVQSKLRAVNLLPQKENFTELYFSNYDKLASASHPYQGKNFNFTIHNLENQDMNYTYEVYLLVDGKREEIVKSSVLIKNGQYHAFRESFSTATVNKRSEVVINLINKNQSIDFWVNE